jgi:hypothetical protein
VAWGLNWIGDSVYQPEEGFYKFLSLGMAALVILQMIFLAIGLFLGCALKGHKRAGSVAISILLGSYVFSSLSELKEEWEFLKYSRPLRILTLR